MKKLIILVCVSILAILATAQGSLTQDSPIPQPESTPTEVRPSVAPTPVEIPPEITLKPEQAQAIKAQLQTDIQTGVDRTLDRINLLIAGVGIALGLITAIPVVVGIVFWWLQRSIIKDISEQVKAEVVKDARIEINQTRKNLADINSILILRQIIELVPEPKVADPAPAQEKEKALNSVRSNMDVLLKRFAKVNPKMPHSLDDLLSHFIHLSPDHQDFFRARDYVRLGNILYLQERYGEAIAYYDNAIRMNPISYEAFNQKGLAQWNTKLYDSAIQSFENAIEIDGTLRQGWNNLAAVLLEKLNSPACASMDQTTRQANLDRILKCVDRAISIDPNFGIAHSNRGYVLAELRQLKPPQLITLQDFQAELDCYTQAAAAEPNNPLLWYNRACCYCEMDKLDAAIESLTEAIYLSPDARDWARQDDDLEKIKQNPRLQALLNPEEARSAPIR